MTHLVWKFCTLTLRYGAVFLWHHRSRPSLAEVSGRGWGEVSAGEGSGPALSPYRPPRHLPSTEMSWMAKRRMMVQIMPRVIFRFPSTISAGWGMGTGFMWRSSPVLPLLPPSPLHCLALGPQAGAGT